jgi:aspartyl-tRNA(Asn)/glutamyl-tRNA(Gln) amidotransferase subunit A
MYYENLDADVDAGVSEAIVVLRRLAASVRDVELPRITVPSTTFAEVAALHSERFEKTPEVFHPSIRPLLERAGKISAGDYIRNRQGLWELRRRTDILFPDVDFLVTPAIDQAALTIEEALKREPMMLNRNLTQFNKFGLPAISVPCGFDRNGLPIGLQIIGKRFQEGQVLALARAYEQATEWHKRRPSL